MTDHPKRKWPRRKWPNPIQLLITVGAIAGAILSIAGVIALFNHGESPSPRGKFESVTADPSQGLTEFSSRLQTASLGSGATGAATAVYAASVRVVPPAQVAQSPTDTTGPESTGAETVPETATPESTGPETTPSETTPSQSMVSGSKRLLTDLQHQLPSETLPPGWKYEITDGEPVLQFPEGMALEAFSYVDADSPGATGSAVVAAKDLARVFHATRTQPVAGSGKTEPVGAAVNFNLSLENLKGRTVVVRWSLYKAGAGSPIPHDWLVNRRVFRGRVDRSTQTTSKQFWVPLPRRRGRYFVRLSAWDGNNRLDYEDSKPPFQ